MDKIKSPFSPGAGAPPPELAGRNGVELLSNVVDRLNIVRRPLSLLS